MFPGAGLLWAGGHQCGHDLHDGNHAGGIYDKGRVVRAAGLGTVGAAVQLLFYGSAPDLSGRCLHLPVYICSHAGMRPGDQLPGSQAQA